MADEQDAIGKTQSLLAAQWNPADTDGVTPSFYVSSEAPMRLEYYSDGTHILIYLPSHLTDPNGLGPSHRERTVDRVSIDIRTKKSRSHLRKCYNECRAIFAPRINDPFGDQSFAQLMPIGFTDFTTQGFYRYVYDIYLKNWTVER